MLYHHRYVRLIALLGLCVLLGACSSTPKTEQMQYQESVNSFTYVAFEKFSRHTVNPALALFNYTTEQGSHSPVRSDVVHSLASVLLALNNNPTLALVEADLAQEAADNEYGRYIANSALSMAMHSNGWPKLGAKYAAKASITEQGKPLDDRYEGSRLTIKALLGLSAIVQGNGPAAEELFAELGAALDNNWLAPTMHGAAILADGPGLSTPRKLKALINRPNLSFSDKKRLTELEVIAEKHQGEPQEITTQTDKLVKKWTLEALSELGETALKATLKIIATVLFGIHGGVSN